MSTTKLLILVAVLAVAGYFGYTYFLGGASMKSLESHMKSKGVTMSVYVPSEEERQLLENFKKDAAKLPGVGTASSNYESTTYEAGSLETPIVIKRFKNESDAKKEYDDEVAAEARAKARYDKSPQAYMRDEWHLRKNFVLQIRHWDSDVVNGKIGSQYQVDLTQSEIDRIVSAFSSF